MVNKLDSSRVTYYPYAECLTCSWTHPMSVSTRDRAKTHARYQSHEVVVVVEDRTLYTGLKDGSS